MNDVQRNKFLFIGIGVIATLLVVSLMVLSASLVRARVAAQGETVEARGENGQAVSGTSVELPPAANVFRNP